MRLATPPLWLTTLRQTFRNPGGGLIRTFLAGRKEPADDPAGARRRRRALEEAIRCWGSAGPSAPGAAGGREGSLLRAPSGRPRAWRFTCCAGALACAQDLTQSFEAPARLAFDTASVEANVAGLVILSLMLLATITAVLHLIGRRIWTRRVHELETELARTNAKLDRAALMLRGELQILVSWERPDAEPMIEGDFALVADSPLSSRVLAFASWLSPPQAAKIKEATERLLGRGEAFAAAVISLRGRHLEIDGRPVSGAAMMRIRDVSGERLQLAQLRDEFAHAEGALEGLRRALEAADMPAWTRDSVGRIVWCNIPYAAAVDAPDVEAAIERGGEMFDPAVRREIAMAVKETGAWMRRASAVVGGGRRTYDAVEARTPVGSAGLARDASEIMALKTDMERNEDDYSRMIDRLSTAVAIFDKSKRLTLYNAAYLQIWSLDPAFLDQGPTDGEILDRLRAKRQLPEQVDFRAWKAQQLSAYQAIEPSETVWHLPDGRALRVVMSPNPKGGVTYLYDDATQSYALASQVTALTHVQGETLDALKEGVAAFGADGRVKLFNPAFAELWEIDPAMLRDRPHIDEIARACTPLCRDPQAFDEIRTAIVDLPEHRQNRAARIERTDGLILDCAALPLAGRSDAPDLARRDRGRQLRACADRAQPGAGGRGEAAQRFRQSCLLRTADAAHQHHWLHPASGRGRGGRAQSEADRICRLHHRFVACIARHHRRHSRSGVDRRRRDGAEARGRRRRRGDEGGGLGRAGSPERGGDRIAHRHDRWRRLAARRRPAGAPDPVQSSLERDQLFGGRPDGHAGGDAARRGDRVQGQRSRARHPARDDRPRLRAVRDFPQRLAPSRPRPWPVDRAEPWSNCMGAGS